MKAVGRALADPAIKQSSVRGEKPIRVLHSAHSPQGRIGVFPYRSKQDLVEQRPFEEWQRSQISLRTDSVAGSGPDSLYTLAMARPVKYSDSRILDATARVVADAGLDGASVAQVAKSLGAPSGSVYHRFPSRKHLLGALWVRTLKSFHDALQEATAEPTAEDLAHRCVTSLFDWINNDPIGSTLLLKFRTEDLIDNDWPTEVRVEVAEESQRLADITNRVAEARGINPLDAILALVDFPAAAARRAQVFGNDVVTEAILARTTGIIRPLLA